MLRELLEVCVQKCIFKFDGEYYEQIDGVSMGNPLGPLFANVFMANLEKNHMEQFEKLRVLVWKRYVDDIFVVLRSTASAKVVQDYLNGIHPNIKFTAEHEKNGSISFLDVLVKRKKGRLHTEMYRKPTFTGVYLNWHSLTSKRYKVGLIDCLLDRIDKICSDQETKDLEIKRTKSILLKNNYPAEILDQRIAKFINRLHVSPSHSPDPNGYTLRSTDVPFDACYMKLPHVGDGTEEFGTKLINLVKKNFPTTRLRIAFTSPAQIGTHFKFKDKITEVEKQSLIVYHIKCGECNENYIGKTSRIFAIRLKENAESVTGREDSSIHIHHLQTGHMIDFKGATILDRADTNHKLEVKEILHIDKLKPTLNVQLNSQSEFRLTTRIIGSKKKEVLQR